MKRTTPFPCALIVAGLVLGAAVGGQAREVRSLPPSTTIPQVTEVQATSGAPDTLTSRGPARPNPQRGTKMSATGGGDHVIIELDFYRAEAWDYDRVTGALNPIAPHSMRYAKALSGSEIVVRSAHAGGSARIVPITGEGSADFSAIERGSFNITLRLPATPGSRAGQTRKAAAVTFHVLIGSEGIVRDQTPQVAITASHEKSTVARK